MMRNKVQTRILINLYSPRNPEIEIERRKTGMPKPHQLGEWYTTKKYHPTEASRKRLEKTVNAWVNKGWADINIFMPLIEIEPTI